MRDRLPGSCWVLSTDPAVSVSVQNLRPSAAPDSALQQQERIMNVSQVLASEASRKSKLVAGWFQYDRLANQNQFYFDFSVEKTE